MDIHTSQPTSKTDLAKSSGQLKAGKHAVFGYPVMN